MANLKPLIRFRKFQVDEKQRVLANLYDEAYQFEQRKSDVLDTISKETKAARDIGTFDMLKQLGAYVNGAKVKIAEYDEVLERLNVRIELAQNDLREHFAELKKIEILHKRRRDELRAQNEAREEALMNEIGILLYNREEDNY